MQFLMRMQNIKFIRITLLKNWMKKSFLSTSTRPISPQHALHFPTSTFQLPSSDFRIPTSHFKTFRLPTSSLRLPTFFLIVLIYILWVPVAVYATDADSGSLTASLDQTSLPVGGVVWLTLDYRLPQGGRLPEKVEVQGLDDLSKIKQIVKPGQIRIQLLVDQVGAWQSEPISLTYLDADGQAQLLTTQPVSIQVVSNLGEKAEAAQLRPIRDIVPVKSIWQSTRLWLAAIAVLVLIGVGLLWWYKKKHTPAALAQYTEPPHIRARRELRGLETKRYFEKGRVKKYYFALSEILRRYLEAIRDFPAAEFTTEEIARHIRDDQDRKLIVLLQQADLVKFADSVPTPARKEEDIKAALAYIRQSSARWKSIRKKRRRRRGRHDVPIRLPGAPGAANWGGRLPGF